MSSIDRILALDAAACASEGTDMPPDLRAARDLLQDELEQYFGPGGSGAMPHELFIPRQRAAVQALFKNPQTYS